MALDLTEQAHYLHYPDDTLFSLQTDDDGAAAFSRFTFQDQKGDIKVPAQYRIMTTTAGALKERVKVPLYPKGHRSLLDPLNIAVTSLDTR